jgi:hypothetical protein
MHKLTHKFSFFLVMFGVLTVSNCTKAAPASVTARNQNASDLSDKVDFPKAENSDEGLSAIKVEPEQSSITKATERSEQILYDFRQIDQFVKPTKFSGAEEKLVLSYAFGEIKGEFAIPGMLRQRLNGSFTAAGKQQTLYLALGREGGGGETQSALVIYEGTKPLCKLKFSGQDILKITDVNRDGRSELLLTTGDVWMSGRELDAQLIQLDESGIEIVKTFANVCATVDSDGHEKTLGEVAEISYITPAGSGEFPAKYAVKRYKCRGTEGAIEPKTCRPK